jgi:DNA-binding NarL/FixJ family response regulator
MPRILIVDDHSLIRRGVRTLLETRPDIEVVGEAGTGREALSIALATKPDIAIIDYSIPELNGRELTLELKKALPRTRVLIYTFHDREEIILDVLRAGAAGYVLKSDGAQDLFSAVSALSIGRSYLSKAISESLVAQLMRGEAQAASGALTHRERQVVQLVAEGMINKQIAPKLGISIKTVETHRANVMQKLNIRTTAEVVRYALRNRIIEE